MQKLFFFIVCITVLMLPSCKNPKESEEYKRLEIERDSLKFAGVKQANEYNDILSLINEVEDKFRDIKEMEDYLTEKSQSGVELNRTTKEKIMSDMQLLTDHLKINKEQILTLQKKLKDSGLKSSELEKRINLLSQEIENKVQTIVTLHDELEKKNIIIAEQGQKIQEQLSAMEKQQEQLISQDESLNAGYYVFGIKKELEREKILVKGKLMQQNHSIYKDYFTQVDIRHFSRLALYSKKAKVLSTHPESSYTLEKGVDKNLTLIIFDQKDFWSVSRHLVIQVD